MITRAQWPRARERERQRHRISTYSLLKITKKLPDDALLLSISLSFSRIFGAIREEKGSSTRACCSRFRERHFP